MIDACENIMVRNGTQRLFKALAKYHYTYAACPVRKMAWGDLAGIKPIAKKRGRPPVQDTRARRVKAYKCIWNIAQSYGLTVDEIKSQNRKAAVTVARNHCFSALHKSGFSYSEIGRIVGRDHSTVMHGVAKHRGAK